MTLCWPGLLRSKQRQWQSPHLISNCAEVQITFNVGCLRHDVYISTLIGSLCEVTDYSLLLFIILQTSDCIKWPVLAHTDHSLMLSCSHPHTSYCQIKSPYFYWATLIGLLVLVPWLAWHGCVLSTPLSPLPGLMLLPKLPASQPSPSQPGQSRFTFLQFLDPIKSRGSTNSQPEKKSFF